MSEAVGRRGNLRFHLVTIVISLATAYLMLVLVRGYMGLSMLASSQVGWSDGLFQADPALGTRLAENTEGYEILHGRRIPVRTGAYGNRVRARGDQSIVEEKGGILFVGDSFTFGAAVEADDSFPSLVGEEAGMAVHNAAVPSYGLAHMVRRTEELVPLIQPEVVVFQYSSWLVDRAMSRYMDTRYMAIPQPYIAGTGELSVHDPLRPNRLIRLSSSKLVEGDLSVLARLWFLLREGVPVIVMHDIDRLKILLGDIFGLNPSAADDPQSTAAYAYGRMIDLAQAYGATPVVLVVGSNQSFEIPFQAFPQGSHVVDAQHSLILMLPERTPQAFAQHYWHWSGRPARLIDTHPNEQAHNIIARTLLLALAQIEQD